MYLNAEVLEAKYTKRTFKNGKASDIFLIVAKCNKYHKIFDLMIFDKKVQEKANKEIKKGMEVIFSFPTVKGNDSGSYNQYAILDGDWKITKTIQDKINELTKELNG